MPIPYLAFSLKAPPVKYDNLSKGKEMRNIKDLQKKLFPGQILSGKVPLI